MNTPIKPMTGSEVDIIESKSQKIKIIQGALDQQMAALLTHPYFQACQSERIAPANMLEIMKNLYCFSVYFERILTRRISHYNSHMDGDLLHIARKHLAEEIGHADMFRDCLLKNGVSEAEIISLVPSRYAKAVFGYMVVTIEYENEYVSNIAVMQVMELIGFYFFNSTLSVMKKSGFSAKAFQAHSDDDSSHSKLGLENCGQMDEATLADCKRIIGDLFALMGAMLDEWLQVQTPVF